MRVCNMAECSKPHRARGLCATHYNQVHQTNRHGKVEVQCDGCGQRCTKEKRAARYKAAYCSELCRDYTRWGGSSCDLPSDHWARMYGATCEWIAPPMPRACGWCGTEYQPNTRHATTFCSYVCKKRQYKATRRGREHGAPGTYSWAEVVRLWVRFDKACAYCATPTPLTEIQAEHVQPISRGGANNLTNLLPSCLACNSDKRDLLLSEWKLDRARRGLAEVTTEWSDTDVRYRHLTSLTQPAMA